MCEQHCRKTSYSVDKTSREKIEWPSEIKERSKWVDRACEILLRTDDGVGSQNGRSTKTKRLEMSRIYIQFPRIRRPTTMHLCHGLWIMVDRPPRRRE